MRSCKPRREKAWPQRGDADGDAQGRERIAEEAPRAGSELRVQVRSPDFHIYISALLDSFDAARRRDDDASRVNARRGRARE